MRAIIILKTWIHVVITYCGCVWHMRALLGKRHQVGAVYGWIPFEWRIISLGPFGNLSPVWGRLCAGPEGRSEVGAGGYAGIRDSKAEPGGANMSRRSGAKWCRIIWDCRRINQQPNRVGFKQVMNGLGALYPLEDRLAMIKTPNANAAAKDLIREEETTVGKILVRMPNVLPGPMSKGIWQRMMKRNYLNNQERPSDQFFESHWSWILKNGLYHGQGSWTMQGWLILSTQKSNMKLWGKSCWMDGDT